MFTSCYFKEKIIIFNLPPPLVIGSERQSDLWQLWQILSSLLLIFKQIFWYRCLSVFKNERKAASCKMAHFTDSLLPLHLGHTNQGNLSKLTNYQRADRTAIWNVYKWTRVPQYSFTSSTHRPYTPPFVVGVSALNNFKTNRKLVKDVIFKKNCRPCKNHCWIYRFWNNLLCKDLWATWFNISELDHRTQSNEKNIERYVTLLVCKVDFYLYQKLLFEIIN